MADWSSPFFNPSATWGGWSSPFNGMVSPNVQNAPSAPSPGGVAPTQPAAAPAATPPAPAASGLFGGGLANGPLGRLLNMGGGTPGAAPAGGSILPNTNATGGSGLNNNMLQLGMKMMQPQQIQPQQIQMAHPIGPGQMPMGGGAGPNPSWGGSSMPNTNMTGAGSANPFQRLGMLGGYGF